MGAKGFNKAPGHQCLNFLSHNDYTDKYNVSALSQTLVKVVYFCPKDKLLLAFMLLGLT